MAAATATAAAAASVTAAATVAVVRAARPCRSQPLGTGAGLTLLRHLSQPIDNVRTRRTQSLPLLHHSSHREHYCCSVVCALARSEQRACMAAVAARGGPATAAAAAGGAAAAGMGNPLHSSRGLVAQQRPTASAAVAAAAAAAGDGEGGSVSVVAEISNEESAKAGDGATNGAPPEAATAAVVAAAADPTTESEDSPKEIFLTDYSPPRYTFDTVHLSFDLHEDYTRVDSSITVKPASETGGPLVLDGSNLELLSVKVDGNDLPTDAYSVTKRHLTLLSPPQSPFALSISTRIDPKNNTSLEGLYKSTSNFCTQCEAEGFRKITYFLDRPDVMAKYTTRIEADEDAYPVLLSNGNLVDQGKAQTAGRHYAVWEDPWPKPSYLFALVAGRLACVEDTFTTASGRNVTLRIFVQPGDEPRTEHAMRSLIASMKWDEEVFGLEYDLDLFNIVAVPDFNMGAMENKSLNIFNSRLVLASPETATDGDYTAIESVVAHEYFHNWTGNRVTCRDWFQLTLKEGLTVYRDQEFSADMNDRAVERINDVVRLRSSQFAQDAGPMAHPVRPLSYIKMDNFYTVTVYEKGAEVVRMYETLLGKDGFRKGMDLYFARHDGCAVTCDDFFAAMRDANSAKLTNFPFWLSQAGTPLVTVTSAYDDKAHTLTLHCRQELPSTQGQPAESKQPMLIPLRVGLVSRTSGNDVQLSAVFDGSALRDVSAGNGTTVLHFDKAEQSFTFTDIEEEVVPSLLRGFSAPVRLRSDLNTADLLFLLANDSDAFNRWEACQTVARELMLAMVAAQQRGEELSLNPTFVEAIRAVVTNPALDKAFIARVLSLPGESEIAELMSPADPDAIHAVSKFCRNEIARQLRPELEQIVEENKAPEGEAYSPDHHSKARRALKNTALLYLASLHDDATVAAAKAAYDSAANMTDQFAALAALSLHDSPERSAALEQFYQQWKHDGLVMNKWLSLQASSAIPGNVERVRSLKSHPAFVITEPNKVYSLMGGFTACAVNFHAADGSGYEFIADSVIELDKINPQVAARIVSAFTRWRNYDQARQEKAKAQLERIAATTGLSENVFEIVSKSLDAPPPS